MRYNVIIFGKNKPNKNNVITLKSMRSKLVSAGTSKLCVTTPSDGTGIVQE